MRDAYEQFKSHGADIVAVGPDTRAAFKQYWKNEKIPFIGLADADHLVAKKYKQEVKQVSIYFLVTVVDPCEVALLQEILPQALVKLFRETGIEPVNNYAAVVVSDPGEVAEFEEEAHA